MSKNAFGGECFLAAAAIVGSSIPKASRAPDGKFSLSGFSPAMYRVLVVSSKEFAGRSTVSERAILNSEEAASYRSRNTRRPHATAAHGPSMESLLMPLSRCGGAESGSGTGVAGSAARRSGARRSAEPSASSPACSSTPPRASSARPPAASTPPTPAARARQRPAHFYPHCAAQRVQPVLATNSDGVGRDVERGVRRRGQGGEVQRRVAERGGLRLRGLQARQPRAALRQARAHHRHAAALARLQLHHKGPVGLVVRQVLGLGGHEPAAQLPAAAAQHEPLVRHARAHALAAAVRPYDQQSFILRSIG
ncbi:unnamed protein product [Spodoptera littoralis]|uniref:Uncharacterized protein n=1 Tax=Spodoptera littoralis TaxID=7109 RepID=A0A9P0I702_SPOLI|nr:unnamed protein product [Spodoptera littoralis]CAH1641167.1 unnamed protein product [Spodoptera littoralis]